MRHALGTELKTFVAKGSPIIGICNGFQQVDQVGTLAQSNTETFGGTGSQSTRSIYRSLGDTGKTESCCL